MAGVVSAQTALAAALAVMDRPWKWGTSDCSTAACEAFALVHGVDPMAGLRGTYTDATGAAAVVAERGGWEALCEALAASAGLRAVAPLEAPAGALGLAVWAGRHSLVFCVGSSWAGKSLRGMALISATGVGRAWRV